jgi:multiple sugar transport system permease protein
MIPGQVLLVPNFMLLNQLGMLDSYTALIVPAMVNISHIFLMRQFFINFPSECEEAAYIDGLGRFSCFFRICMPLARTAIATQAVFVFMGFWNEFTRPMLYIRSMDMLTLPVGLQMFQSRDAGQMWHQIMAAATITVLPIVIIYLIFNKYFLIGLRMDGDK